MSLAGKLVAGIDSSTQSCKVVVRDAASGALLREGRASHPDGSEIDPEHWWAALQQAAQAAGGLDDVVAIAVGGQQHGMVALDAAGQVIRPALLWNDTRSAPQAERLTRELGAETWAQAVGLVPVASFTVTKLAWLREHEPQHAARVRGVALPHDWLTWRLMGGMDLETLVTDRGDASGTGYFDAVRNEYRRDLLTMALGHDAVLPRVLGPGQCAGEGVLAGLGRGVVFGPGTGDNMAAALGVGAGVGDVIVSIGTSGVVSAVAEVRPADATGTVAGFADATGRFLPLCCTLNAARVLDATAQLLSVDHAQLSELALAAPAGADGLVLVPYLDGERTPNRPDATGALHGMQRGNTTPMHVARAAFEGMLCGLADGLDAMRLHGVKVRRVLLVGGGARSAALCRIAPTVLGVDVVVPPPGELVADGAARQAAWVLSGAGQPPVWPLHGAATFVGEVVPAVRERYAEVREMTARRR